MAALAAGCGDDDDSTAASGGAAISKAEFVAQANAICKTSRKKIVAAALETFRSTDEGPERHDLETKLVSTLLIPTLRDEIAELRALGTPAGDEDEIDAILAATQEALDEAREEPQTYVQAEGSYRSGQHHYGKATRLAKEYGLRKCPQG